MQSVDPVTLNISRVSLNVFTRFEISIVTRIRLAYSQEFGPAGATDKDRKPDIAPEKNFLFYQARIESSLALNQSTILEVEGL